MKNSGAIPDGYMTVGQASKKMGVTVRTLQHYDRIGLLSPSASSEGGRRLYSDKDLIKLHQILSLKSLGFSLEDIKERLISLDTPEQVAKALEEQAASLKMRISALNESLRETEALREQVLAMGKVDFKRYADIIVNLQMNNEYYWLIKHFDDDTMDHIRKRFDRDSGRAFIDGFMALQQRAIELLRDGASPDSPEGIAFGEKFWSMIVDFTGGDMSMLPKLMEAGSFTGADPSFQDRVQEANAFIGPALEAYFKATGTDPFNGGSL